MPSKKEQPGCGCASIPISLIVVLLGVGYWGFTQLDHLKLGQFFSEHVVQLLPEEISKYFPNRQASSAVNAQQPTTSETPVATPALVPNSPQVTPSPSPTPSPQATPAPVTNQQPKPPKTAWESKEIRGIYLSRYQVTNNASEKMIRERVRYYRQQGINTIIHGVWGNGCTMYHSDVMQQTFGYKSCPNQFQEKWLDWLIDEAHKQGMQVHAYFEKGIKLDKNSPIFDTAIANRWIVPGVDKTYAGIDHYVLDVEVPEVANFFRKIAVEFVKKYPQIDAVQWDDYLGYHAELPGKVDRTAHLTNFVRQMRAEIKQANPKVSFDLCHHNPYWGKRYFAADWTTWNIDRAFIQVYNDANFADELVYAEQYAGVAISDQQLHRLKALVNNPKIKSILIFPTSGKPEAAATAVKKVIDSQF